MNVPVRFLRTSQGFQQTLRTAQRPQVRFSSNSSETSFSGWRKFLPPVRYTGMGPNYKYKFIQEPATVAIVACPFSGGQGRAGVDLAPNKLIAAGLPNQLSQLGWQVHYHSQQSFSDIPYNPIPADSPAATTLAGQNPVQGTTEPTPGEVVSPKYVQRLPDPDIGVMKKPRLVSAVCERVAGEVGGAAEKGWLPLTLGGDHSLAMGTVMGTKSKYPDACLIWVDAHADINTPETTDSGNLHGCPVSFLLGLDGCDVEPFNQWVKPCLKPTDIVYIGLRDLDAPEKAILKANNIKCFTMHEFDKYGIGKVMELALDYVNPNRERPTHLSFDVDALDPSVAPSTGTPVRGGLTFREGHYITEAVAETGCLVAIDIMEVNPSLLDPVSVEQTVAIGCSLARAALAYSPGFTAGSTQSYNNYEHQIVAQQIVMVQFYRKTHEYPEPPGTSILAFFLRYPNPFARHVLSVDVLSRRINPKTGQIHTLRLILKRGILPTWASRWLPRSSSSGGRGMDAWVLEESVVDPPGWGGGLEGEYGVEPRLRVKQGNLNHRKLMHVVEGGELRAGPSGSTTHHTTAEVRSDLGGAWSNLIRQRIESYGVGKFEVNAETARKGMTLILSMLKNRQPLPDTAEFYPPPPPSFGDTWPSIPRREGSTSPASFFMSQGQTMPHGRGREGSATYMSNRWRSDPEDQDRDEG